MSAAVLERRAGASALPQGTRSLPARAIEQVESPEDLGHFFGLQMIQTHAALCSPEIEAGDCIEVDFDRREVRHDGLYMIAISHDGGSHWYGARRFALRPAASSGTELWGFDICAAQWAPVTPAMRLRITVYGEVREVYKAVSKLRRLA